MAGCRSSNNETSSVAILAAAADADADTGERVQGEIRSEEAVSRLLHGGERWETVQPVQDTPKTQGYVAPEAREDLTYPLLGRAEQSETVVEMCEVVCRYY